MLNDNVKSSKHDSNVLRENLVGVRSSKNNYFSQVLKVQQGGGITHSEGCQN